MKKTLCFLVLSVMVWAGCKKDHSAAQWNVEMLAPICKTSLTISNIISDSIRQVANDGAVSVVYNGDIYSTPIDSFFQFHDTLMSTAVTFPVDVSLDPGFTFYNFDQTVYMNTGDVELTFTLIKKGFAHLVAHNHLHTKVFYTFTIPKATLGGIPFRQVIPVDAAPVGGVTEFDSLYDISGYSVDLTGVNGNTYNTITYNIVGQTDSTGSSVFVPANDTIVDVKTGFRDLLPRYGRGYLGQGGITVENQALDIGFTKVIQSGTLLLDSINAHIDIENSVGADAQAVITSMKSINSRTGTTVDLVSPSIINHTININRATETGPPVSPVNSTHYSLALNNTNSNILQFIENLPQQVNYSMHLNLNPLGNISGNHDFLYTDKLFDTKLSFNFPLRFAASQLAFVDTVNIEFKHPEDFDAVGAGIFTIIADNGFPYEMQLQISILDDSNHATDVLLVPGTIAPAPVNSSLRATTKQRTSLKIAFDGDRKTRLLNAHHLAVSAKFSTSNYPQVMQVYSDYAIDFKLVGDVQYLVH